MEPLLELPEQSASMNYFARLLTSRNVRKYITESVGFFFWTGFCRGFPADCLGLQEFITTSQICNFPTQANLYLSQYFATAAVEHLPKYASILTGFSGGLCF